MTKQAMSVLVADLERLGYLQRWPDPSDGRARLIGFTDKGRAAVKAAARAFKRMDVVIGHESLSLQRHLLLATLQAHLSPEGPPS